ncbi:hypothetical protein BAMA_18725 [Bacillus manliponensis]|uniref:Colicin immunity protein n=1 Tax=Bacillus manliponensis TaxID=574376 RepID=A0A073K037_9BACI|nr:bacteriocin immunity protein [Bacillus manliponensis]KEK19817.1 hypothetical protein BAMA_18725 [Bacillus manliponensis]
MSCKLTKVELLKLVKNIYNLDLPEEKHTEYVYQFNNIGLCYPSPSDLIFWHDVELTPEEVVEIVWNYKKDEEITN